MIVTQGGVQGEWMSQQNVGFNTRDACFICRLIPTVIVVFFKPRPRLFPNFNRMVIAVTMATKVPNP